MVIFFAGHFFYRAHEVLDVEPGEVNRHDKPTQKIRERERDRPDLTVQESAHQVARFACKMRKKM